MEDYKILVVDADPKNLNILKDAFEAAGFTIKTAGDGEAAWHVINTDHPDLVISEVNLPECDGFSLLNRMKHTGSTSNIPLVFLTNRRDIQDRVRSLRGGVKDYMIKPVHVKEVIARVRMILRRMERVTNDEKSAQRIVGRLEEISVVDLIENLGVERRTGVLNIFNENNKNGEILFRSGAVVAAQLGPLKAEKAIYQMLPWKNGHYVMTFKDVNTPDTISVSNLGLLLQGFKRLEDREKLIRKLPSLETTFVISESFKKIIAQKELSSDVAKFLNLINGKRDIQQIIDESVYDDLKTLSKIAKLYEQGFIKPGTASEIEQPEEINIGGHYSQGNAQKSMLTPPPQILTDDEPKKTKPQHKPEPRSTEDEIVASAKHLIQKKPDHLNLEFGLDELSTDKNKSAEKNPKEDIEKQDEKKPRNKSRAMPAPNINLLDDQDDNKADARNDEQTRNIEKFGSIEELHPPLSFTDYAPDAEFYSTLRALQTDPEPKKPEENLKDQSDQHAEDKPQTKENRKQPEMPAPVEAKETQKEELKKPANPPRRQPVFAFRERNYGSVRTGFSKTPDNKSDDEIPGSELYNKREITPKIPAMRKESNGPLEQELPVNEAPKETIVEKTEPALTHPKPPAIPEKQLTGELAERFFELSQVAEKQPGLFIVVSANSEQARTVLKPISEDQTSERMNAILFENLKLADQGKMKLLVTAMDQQINTIIEKLQPNIAGFMLLVDGADRRRIDYVKYLYQSLSARMNTPGGIALFKTPGKKMLALSTFRDLIQAQEHDFIDEIQPNDESWAAFIDSMHAQFEAKETTKDSME